MPSALSSGIAEQWPNRWSHKLRVY